MSRRIFRDWKDFRDIISGRIRKALKKFIDSGKIFRARKGKRGISIPVPRINQPHIIYGEPEDGVGRGPGKEGDTVGEDKEKGKGNKASQGEGDVIEVEIEMEEIQKFLKEDLKLPNMKPKDTQTYEEIQIKYNNIAKNGPKSLIHKRRTIKECLKRTMASGEYDKPEFMPGSTVPVRVLRLSNDDFRYRQWNEIKIPSSNAVIFFARDGSGSMDTFKCDIVSDMAWWLDLWIRSFYKRTDRVYVWHDTEAKEVSEKNFYRDRQGGGTTCSSAMKKIAKIIKDRYPPEKWNIYVFYFSDGENWSGDNKVFVDVIKQQLNPQVVNMVGVAQIHAWRYQDSLRAYVDEKIKSGALNKEYVRTTSVAEGNGGSYLSFYNEGQRDDKVDLEIRDGIMRLLGAVPPAKEDAGETAAVASA